MEKEIVPFEESYELQKLGFLEPCFAYYGEINGGEIELFFKRNFDTEARYVLAPTISQAFRWFRQNHQLPCWVYTSNNKEYWYSALKNGSMIVRDYEPFQSYEEAELTCLRKLIEIVKNK